MDIYYHEYGNIMEQLCKLPPKPSILIVKPSKDIIQMILDVKKEYFSQMSNSMIFGGHFENMQIRSLRRHFSACQHWFLDSAYQITHNEGAKTFSSQNACTC